jgi:hypothetical protein
MTRMKMAAQPAAAIAIPWRAIHQTSEAVVCDVGFQAPS